MSRDDAALMRLRRPVARMQAGVLAFTGGIVGGVGLFLATAWLLLRGGDAPGYHLNLLGQYFPGYAVTWGGSLLGLFYGALVGATIGAACGWLYNFAAIAAQRLGGGEDARR